jgi:hypothetical protein
VPLQLFLCSLAHVTMQARTGNETSSLLKSAASVS